MTDSRAPGGDRVPTIDPRTGLEMMSSSECLQLLGSHGLGRLAVVVDERPLIFPVNYALHEGAVVFRTDAGTKLFGAAAGHDVAFEIDGADPLYHTGWSVLVVGTASEIVDAADLSRLSHLHLGHWCPGPTSHRVRIRPRATTRRRIPLHHESARR